MFFHFCSLGNLSSLYQWPSQDFWTKSNEHSEREIVFTPLRFFVNLTFSGACDMATEISGRGFNLFQPANENFCALSLFSPSYDFQSSEPGLLGYVIDSISDRRLKSSVASAGHGTFPSGYTTAFYCRTMDGFTVCPCQGTRTTAFAALSCQLAIQTNSTSVDSPCYLISRCPVSRCQPLQFWRSRDVMSRVFSRPTTTTTTITTTAREKQLLSKTVVTCKIKHLQNIAKNILVFYCIGLPIHCNYQLAHYTGFCRISRSILNRIPLNLQA